LRLLYIVVDDLTPSAEELKRLTAGGQAAVGEGSTFTVEPIDIGPRRYYENAVGLAMCVPGILLKLIERQSEFDAALLGCWGDPGLRAARSVSAIPVIGAAEASVALASLTSRRFGVVTIESSDIPEIEAYLVGLEAIERCVGVRAVELPFYALVDDPSETLRRLVAQSRPLIAAGAQAILLGCMSFGFYPFAAKLHEALGVPVIDPLLAGVNAARASLSMEAVAGPHAVARVDDMGPLVEWLEAVRAGLARPSTQTVGSPSPPSVGIASSGPGHGGAVEHSMRKGSSPTTRSWNA
jgi:allantoin racemase